MTAVLNPPPLALSRLYDRERPPFRLTPKTVLAVGLVGALHIGVGLVIARAYFALPPPEQIDKPILLETIPLFHPKPVVVDHPPVAQSHPVEAFVPHDPPAASTSMDSEAIPVIASPTGAEVGLPPLLPARIDPPVPPLPPRPPPVISNPDWLSRPTADQIGKLYPSRALEREVGGKATLLCEVLTSGAVSNCNIVEETPKGYRFGEAAQAMTKYFKLSPRTEDGVSVAGSKVRIPIVFNAT